MQKKTTTKEESNKQKILKAKNEKKITQKTSSTPLTDHPWQPTWPWPSLSQGMPGSHGSMPGRFGENFGIFRNFLVEMEDLFFGAGLEQHAVLGGVLWMISL